MVIMLKMQMMSVIYHYYAETAIRNIRERIIKYA